MKIVAHTLVKNEQNWVWFAIQSVLNWVDEVLVWDTGSTDATVEIIQSITDPKIKFREYGAIDAKRFTVAHQEMLESTRADWLLWLDGDEIWPDESISQTVAVIRAEGDKYDFLVHRFYNLLGDVYHYQEERAGRYRLGPYSGHVTIRAINLKRIHGLHFSRPHGQIGLFDDRQTLIQEREPWRAKLVDCRYLHATHLYRSTGPGHELAVPKRQFKYKYEWGQPFPADFVYPKVFYLPRPSLVPSPWQRAKLGYWLNSAWQTPLRWLKRRWLPSVAGY